MPLTLNSINSERPKQFLWDPHDEKETAEMLHTIGQLKAKGYDANIDASDGSAVLMPPRMDDSLFVFRVLSENGDDRLIWSRHSLSQIEEARKSFYEYLEKGYKAYVVRRCGAAPGSEVNSFDDIFEEVVMTKDREALLVPPVVPG